MSISEDTRNAQKVENAIPRWADFNCLPSAKIGADNDIGLGSVCFDFRLTNVVQLSIRWTPYLLPSLVHRTEGRYKHGEHLLSK